MASAVRPCGAYSLLMNAGEALVGRNDVSVDGVSDLLCQPLLVFERRCSLDISLSEAEKDQRR